MNRYEFSIFAAPRYLPEQSDLKKHNYAFSYTITIRNTGNMTAQLIARHWTITDDNHNVKEVKGLGVVGYQPLLAPGEHFEYTSWASIGTTVGTMSGSFFCVAEDGTHFNAPVPEFSLNILRTLH